MEPLIMLICLLVLAWRVTRKTPYHFPSQGGDGGKRAKNSQTFLLNQLA